MARRRGQQAAAIIRPVARQADTNSGTGTQRRALNDLTRGAGFPPLSTNLPPLTVGVKSGATGASRGERTTLPYLSQTLAVIALAFPGPCRGKESGTVSLGIGSGRRPYGLQPPNPSLLFPSLSPADSGGHPQFHPHADSQKESPYGLHTISFVIPPAWCRLLLGDACVSELPCQEWPVSPRGCDWGVNRHQKWRTRVPGDSSRAARLIARIPVAVRLWPKWARASWDTLLGLHETGGTNEQPSQLRSHPGRTRCDPAR